MLITDNFDFDTSAEWLLYNNAGARSVVNNQLVYENQSSTTHGILLSPYTLLADFTLSVEMRLLTDYIGEQRGGVWLLDKDKANGMQFYFEGDHCGSIYAPSIRTDGRNPAYRDWLNTPISPTFNSGKVFTMKIVKTGNNINYYLDNVLMRSMTAIADIKYFALFAHGSKVAYDNIQFDALAVTGNSKQDDGTSSRFILINNWQTGDFIKKITPRANGDWKYIAPNTNKLIISHIGNDGFAPKIDAPITPA